MERDLFSVKLLDGTERKMEIVSIFNIDDSEYNYIIYSELDRSHYYFAKYLGEDIVDLIVDVDEKESAAAVEVMNGVVGSWS